jgi:aspartate aminotransferase-like enzyme
MLRIGHYVFKRAETKQEFDQVHRLNYRTFVTEIPQHQDPGTGLLVDKFHDKSAYLIALRGGRVVAMVSVHDQPPFSVADRLPDPDVLRLPGTHPLEVRLLAIEPAERNSLMFFGMIWFSYNYALAHGKTHMYISGVEERLGLYRRIGFRPLGPAVRSGGASFVPMVLDLYDMPGHILRMKRQWETRYGQTYQDVTPPGPGGNGTPGGGAGDGTPAAADAAPPPAHVTAVVAAHAAGPRTEVCLLPGPVTASPAVRRAFHESPIYHRGPEFIERFVGVRRTLGRMVGGRDVAILNGSGTLANEAVAATLAADPRGGRGVLLSNGEFGQRLARQATRFGLTPRVLTWPWGRAWDLDEVARALAAEPPASWVWGVHQESSTGVLNDLPGLIAVARRYGVRVCVDCISSLGAVPLDLGEVYLATGATGKSLGSYAGAALLFADARALARIDRSRIPSYFDIAAHLGSSGPCYTFPSPTLCALETALAEYATPAKAQARYEHYAALGRYVRGELRELGLEPLAGEECACPVVTTFAPAGEETSAEFVERCRSWGFAIGGQSGYLAERRLVQIATMGAVTRADCEPLFKHLRKALAALAAACAPVG